MSQELPVSLLPGVVLVVFDALQALGMDHDLPVVVGCISYYRPGPNMSPLYFSTLNFNVSRNIFYL